MAQTSSDAIAVLSGEEVDGVARDDREDSVGSDGRGVDGSGAVCGEGVMWRSGFGGSVDHLDARRVRTQPVHSRSGQVVDGLTQLPSAVEGTIGYRRFGRGGSPAT